MSFLTSQGLASKNLGQFEGSKRVANTLVESPRLWRAAFPWDFTSMWKTSREGWAAGLQSRGCTPHSLHDLSLTLPTASPIFKTGITNLPTSLQPICLVCKLSRAEAGFYLCVQHHIQPGPALGHGSRQDWNTKQWRYLDQTWTTRINKRKAAWYFFPRCLCFSVTCLFISKPQQTSNQAVKEADLWSVEHLGSC